MSSRIFADVSSPSRCAALFPKDVAACEAFGAAAKARTEAALTHIANTTDRSFTSIADTIDIAMTELSIATSILTCVSQVAVERAVRDAATKQSVELASFATEKMETNRAVYEALRALAQDSGFQSEYVNTSKNPEYHYWLQEKIAAYERKGMALSEEKLKEVIRLQKELAGLCAVFSQNLAEDTSAVAFTADELKGVAESTLSGLAKDSEGRYVCKMDYPTYFEVVRKCEVASTRKAMNRAFDNRAFPANTVPLQKIIAKRHELAALLGFESFAHYYISDKMAKTPETAQHFMDGLLPGLQAKWQKELALLKDGLHPSCVLTPDGGLEAYDVSFMMNIVKGKLLSVDEAAIQEYFPADVAIQGLLTVYEEFLDIKMSEIKNGDELWHPEARTLQLKDRHTDALIGHVILDLYPREGKFTHGCCHSSVPPVRLPGSETSFSPALGIVVVNLTKATADRPSLFTFEDAITFFHEFGHAIHGLMGRAMMSSFAGTRVKNDYVEVPSQTLEEWMWQPEILAKITSHYKTGEKLPMTLIEAKIKSKSLFGARDTLRQLQFAQYSLSAFSKPFSTDPRAQQDSAVLDTSALFNAVKPRIMPGVHCDEATHMECSFMHLTGYTAGVYGYTWAKVFALDVFDYIKTHDGLLNPKLGRRYIEYIIGPGGSQDPNVLLRKFLEREPNNKAFLENVVGV